MKSWHSSYIWDREIDGPADVVVICEPARRSGRDSVAAGTESAISQALRVSTVRVELADDFDCSQQRSR